MRDGRDQKAAMPVTPRDKKSLIDKQPFDSLLQPKIKNVVGGVKLLLCRTEDISRPERSATVDPSLRDRSKISRATGVIVIATFIPHVMFAS